MTRRGDGGGFQLKVLQGSHTARRVWLPPGEHLVGSLADCRVHLDERSVSRRHATIEVLADGGALVTDLGSKNGTFLDSRRIAREVPVPPPGTLSPEMELLYRRAGKVARGEVSVLIRGESGVGKEVLARWVHAASRRAAGPFLAINCAALPRDLLEAELFGIERGVATGVEARAGLLERAHRGTLFLDEIGDMPLETQAKVLRAVESKTLHRVGGREPVEIDVRFLAATNRDLEAAIEAGAFRRDLYHRLAAFVVVLPPLRERAEDLPLLAAFFFRRAVERTDGGSPGITTAALSALVAYAWPGNVRELENEIAQAVLLLEPGEPLDLSHLSPALRAGPGREERPLTLAGALRAAERRAFAIALAASGGDAKRAMDLLDLPRTIYYRKLRELGVAEAPPPGGGPAAP